MVQPEVRRGSDRRILAALGIAIFAILVVSPNVMVTDSIRVVPVAHNLLTKGTITFDPQASPFPAYYGVTARGGSAYPLFPWTISLFLIPAVGAMDLAHGVGVGRGAGTYGGGSPNDWPLEVLTMSVVVAATALLMYLVGAELTNPDDQRSRRRLGLAAAVLFAFCTAAWSTASRAAWQHGPSMLFLTWAVLLALRSRRRPLAAGWFGVALAAALVVRPTNVVGVAALGIWALAVHRRQALKAVPSALVVLVPFAIVNLVAYGALLPPYFLGNSLQGNAHLLEALAGNLVSPARGLLVFSPIALLAPVGIIRSVRNRSFDGLDAALAATIVAHWVLISRLPHWWGGFQYGPRLFTDMWPFLIILSLPAIDAIVAAHHSRLWYAAGAATAVLAGWSFFVNAEGALLSSSSCWNITPNVEGHPNRVWSWSDPQVLAGARGVLRYGLASELASGGYANSTLTGCPGAVP